MRTVVLAYGNIGCVGIKALLKQGFEIAAVFTHQDHPQETVWFDSVAELASEHRIPVFAPTDINHPLWIEKIRELGPDILFSFYYRNLIHRPILDIPQAGCLNLHGSLLPKYRGRAPINWVLVNGEKETGVTLHYMTPHADEGDIVAQERVEISDDDTALTLHWKVTQATDKLLNEVLPHIQNGTPPRTPQDHAQATYFGGRQPADGAIDWFKTAHEIRNLVRAVTKPFPGAFSFIGERRCFFWEVRETGLGAGKHVPGSVISTKPLTIGTAEMPLWSATARPRVVSI